jgi:large conductance mechanosensitive channel
MAFFQEFKKFAMRGNAIDMAVGIVIGANFTNIVNAIVEKVFTPITAYLTGNADVADLSYELPSILGKHAVIGYGAVAQAIIQFLIVAFVLFLVVRAMNRLKLDLGTAPTPEDVRLLREIRDLLAARSTP